MPAHEVDLVPLITAEQAFPQMESLVLGAEKTLDLALHIFSPRTKTRSADAHRAQLTDWGSLLADRLSWGVRVRLLLNDFDPIGAPDMHATVWERLRHLDGALAALTAEQRAGFQLLCAHPGGQSGALLRTLVWPIARSKAKSITQAFQARGRQLPPGFYRDGDQVELPLWPPRRNYTQTLHQKFIIADRKKAILGGLDIDERRYDDPDHQRSAPQTWHDVSVAMEGPEVAQLANHFDRCWTRTVRDGFSHADAFGAANPDLAIDLHPPQPATINPSQPMDKDKSPISIAVTMPQPGQHPLRFGPQADIRELETAHLALFSRAERFIYIESQFFRSSVIRDGLVAALGENPDLHVMMLLPGAPDVIAYEGEESAVHRYGEWLQMRALNRLTHLFPDRFAAFSLTSDVSRHETGERDALYGKSMVYVHSKVAIADDEIAIVSSANLNARSMQWDVEAGIVAESADFASQLRQQLWHAHLGSAATLTNPTDDPAGTFSFWCENARQRSSEGARAQGTGVVPFPLQKTRRFAKRHIFIPEQMV